MDTENLMNIAQRFDIDAKPTSMQLIDIGHINKTYLVDYDNNEKRSEEHTSELQSLS